jgi:hypothetical protein
VQVFRFAYRDKKVVGVFVRFSCANFNALNTWCTGVTHQRERVGVFVGPKARDATSPSLVTWQLVLGSLPVRSSCGGTCIWRCGPFCRRREETNECPISSNFTDCPLAWKRRCESSGTKGGWDYHSNHNGRYITVYSHRNFIKNMRCESLGWVDVPVACHLAALC